MEKKSSSSIVSNRAKIRQALGYLPQCNPILRAFLVIVLHPIFDTPLSFYTSKNQHKKEKKKNPKIQAIDLG